MTAAIAYRVELELIAKKQAEAEINKEETA
jgi:hypothetical protein